MSYIGAQPTTAAFPFDQFSGNGSTTVFTMSYAPASTTSMVVCISGVVQNPNTYNISGLTLTFTQAPPTGTNNIGILYLGLPVQVGVPTPGSTVQFALGSAANPSITFLGDTNTGIYSPGADTLAFVEGGAEVMRMDSSGNVGVGTTTPITKLTVSGSSSIVGELGTLAITGNTTAKRLTFGVDSTSTMYGWIQAVENGITARDLALQALGGSVLVGTTATINTSGVLISKGGAAGGGIIQLMKTGSGNTNGLLNYYGSTYVGGLNFDNTSTSVATSSDIRLKKDVVDAPSAINTANSIRVVSHGWKHDEATVKYGFIAQELIDVVPEAVMQGDDGEEVKDTWTVDYARLVPILTKALQELKAELDVCKAEIAALKGV